jgi:hypothetical protein
VSFSGVGLLLGWQNMPNEEETVLQERPVLSPVAVSAMMLATVLGQALQSDGVLPYRQRYRSLPNRVQGFSPTWTVGTFLEALVSFLEHASQSGALRGIVRPRALDQISGASTAKIDEGNLHYHSKKPDDLLLEEFFDAHRVPENLRSELVTSFCQETIRVTTLQKQIVLPDAAPKLYPNRPKGQSIVEYLRDPEGWGPFVEAGVLTRPDLLRLDPKAYRALYNAKGPLPTDVDLPTKSEALDRMVSMGNVPTPSLPRVGQTLERRRQRAARSPE